VVAVADGGHVHTELTQSAEGYHLQFGIAHLVCSMRWTILYFPIGTPPPVTRITQHIARRAPLAARACPVPGSLRPRAPEYDRPCVPWKTCGKSARPSAPG